MVFAVRMHSLHLHYMYAYRLQHLQLRDTDLISVGVHSVCLDLCFCCCRTISQFVSALRCWTVLF